MNESSNNYSSEEQPKRIAMTSTQRHRKYLEDPINKEKHSQRMKDHYETNKEDRQLYCKQWNINRKLRASAAAQTY